MMGWGEVIEVGTAVADVMTGGGGGGSGSGVREPSSNPREAGFVPIGRQRGYPKIWINGTMQALQISDGFSSFTVQPGGRIQQGGPAGNGQITLVGQGGSDNTGGAEPGNYFPALPDNRPPTPITGAAMGTGTLLALIAVYFAFVKK